MAKLNPVFSGIKVDEGIESAATVKGVAGKTFILLIITVISAILSINYGISMVFDNPFILSCEKNSGETSPFEKEFCVLIKSAIFTPNTFKNAN
jgi:hypothetical protein